MDCLPPVKRQKLDLTVSPSKLIQVCYSKRVKYTILNFLDPFAIAKCIPTVAKIFSRINYKALAYEYISFEYITYLQKYNRKKRLEYLYPMPEPYLVNKASALPEYYVFLRTLLLKQPLFPNPTGIHKVIRILPLKSVEDTHIFDILTSIAHQHFQVNTGPIHDYGIGGNRLYNEREEEIPSGIQIWHFLDHPMCSARVLKDVIERIIYFMNQGWVCADPRDYPDALFRENPKEYDFFVRKYRINLLDDLLASICKKFSIKGVKCYDNWKMMGDKPLKRKAYYMWIHKKNKDKIQEQLGLSFVHEKSIKFEFVKPFPF